MDGLRFDGRKRNQLRDIRFSRNYISTCPGSVLVEMGRTRVLCTATVEDRVPPHVKGTGKGWVTAEYAMLPRSSAQRVVRERSTLKTGGRTHEIQRLIGRSLRAVTDLKALGEVSVIVDCDVIEADGGTRTASINGAFVALVDALAADGRWQGGRLPVKDWLAAVSCGIVAGMTVVDLAYAEDSMADVDMNMVMTGSGGIVELQGTAEGEPFTKEGYDLMIDMAEEAVGKIVKEQRTALGEELSGRIGAI
ncbi:MAG: Ribonuclease PH [Firmicutes bacterium ADurb.Bin153]|nr:MAG: Ribonuclease PH [Firmicutes bacterium ADurb.Bin153]